MSRGAKAAHSNQTFLRGVRRKPGSSIPPFLSDKSLLQFRLPDFLARLAKPTANLGVNGVVQSPLPSSQVSRPI